jgi:hypothetical protein
MKHYLFIKDNGTEIVSVIKDSMRRKRHYLFIKDNETVILFVTKDNMRR